MPTNISTIPGPNGHGATGSGANGMKAVSRVDFSKIRTSIAIPNLIEVQRRSYERFLQMYTAPADREDAGL